LRHQKELISELSGSDDPRDQEQVAEFLRETAQATNATIFNRDRKKIIAQLPPGALDGYLETNEKYPGG
jgi:hypothetical protein